MRGVILVVLLFFVLALSACGGSTASDARAVETQVAAKIFATQTASVPTETPTPRPTVTPEATATPEPTLIPRPTITPEPTETPQPTDTPAPVAPIPPRGTYKHKYEIVEEYNRFNGRTEVTLHPRISEYERGPNNWLVFYNYPGEKPAVPDAVGVVLSSASDTWEYLKCHSFDLLLDGQTALHPPTGHDGTIGDGYVIEHVMMELQLDEFLQLVNAQKVEAMLCGTEFVLSGEQMEALRDVASRMQP